MSRGRSSVFDSLRSRLMIMIVAIAVLPMIAVVVIVGNWMQTSLERQSLRLQQEVAVKVQAEVAGVIEGLEEHLVMFHDVYGLGSQDREAQRAALGALLARERLYQELAVVDAGGQEQVRVSRARVVLEPDLQSRAGDPVFVEATRTAAPVFGPVHFDDRVREPLATMAVPLLGRRTGAVESVVFASVRFKPIWDLLGELAEEESSDIYIVTSAGMVIAHRNPAIVLRGTEIALPPSDGRAVGLSGEEAVIATVGLTVGGQELVVVAEQPLAIALAMATRAFWVALGVTIVALLLAIVLVVVVSHRLVKPIETLAGSARRITDGDLSHRASVTSRGEIGELATAFNSMTQQLSSMIATLESHVRDRTAELEEAVGEQHRLITELETRNLELEDARRELEQLVSSKDQFLGSVSHELRTPLTSVVGFAEELRDRYPDFLDEHRRALVGLIAEQAQEMARIIEDLLVAARNADVPIEPVRIDMGAEVAAVLDLLPDKAVRLSLPPTPVWALADATRTRQIIRNLVGNSFRYGGDRIEIRVDSTGSDVVVQVRDDGAGVPEDRWDQIFEAYQTAHHDHAHPASVGLGLTVSRGLARRMGGNLTYRYEHGESVFELTVPRPVPSPALALPMRALQPTRDRRW